MLRKFKCITDNSQPYYDPNLFLLLQKCSYKTVLIIEKNSTLTARLSRKRLTGKTLQNSSLWPNLLKGEQTEFIYIHIQT